MSKNPKVHKGSYSGYILGNIYTLRAMAADIGVSTGLIYKIETIFGLRDWSSRLSGKKSVYTEAHKIFFTKVNFLRNLYYSNLADIKALYELEKRVNYFVEQHFSAKKLIGNDKEIGYIRVFLITGLECSADGIMYDRSAFKKDRANAEKLEAICEEYTEIFKKLVGVAHQRQEEIKNKVIDLELVARGRES